MLEYMLFESACTHKNKPFFQGRNRWNCGKICCSHKENPHYKRMSGNAGIFLSDSERFFLKFVFSSRRHTLCMARREKAELRKKIRCSNKKIPALPDKKRRNGG